LGEGQFAQRRYFPTQAFNFMKICGLQKTTLIDYPGHVACTVFTAGCNFRCPWCYSKELVLPELIVQQPQIPEEEILEFLRTKQGLLEGAVICGGEPTLHPDLSEFCQKIKDLGFLVKLDTNGSNPKMLKELIDRKLIDYVAMDIKLPKERYAMLFADIDRGSTPVNLTGVEPLSMSADDIETSIKILKNSAVDFEFRTTCAPTIHTPDDFEIMAKWIGQDVLGRPPKYFLQNFKPGRNIDPRFENLKPFDNEFFTAALAKIKPYVPSVRLRDL